MPGVRGIPLVLAYIRVLGTRGSNERESGPYSSLYTGGFQHPQGELALTPLIGGVLRGDGPIGGESEASRSDEIILLHQNSNWARRGPGQKYPLFILLDQKERLLLLMADDTPVVLSWLLYRYLMRISASRESRLGNLAAQGEGS